MNGEDRGFVLNTVVKNTLEGDFDGDGKRDILWHHPVTGDVWIWLLDGAMETPRKTVKSCPGFSPDYEIVEVADFDGDARADLLWRDAVSGDVRMWLMEGTLPLQAADIKYCGDANLE